MPAGSLAFICALGLLVSAPAAMADVRYAEADTALPHGGDPCLQADPCDIETAVEHVNVQSGDEVVVLPGNHGIGAGELTIADDITVHGSPGTAKPAVVSSGPIVVNVVANARVEDLRILGFVGSAVALRFAGGFNAKASHLEATSLGGDACGAPSGPQSYLRDSVCWSDGNDSGDAALVQSVGTGGVSVTFTYEIVNVTAIGSEDSSGILIDAAGNADLVLNATNVIARTELGVNDVHARTDGVAGTTATVNLDHSNYQFGTETGAGASVTNPGSPTNQTDLPNFVSFGDGNFRQDPGSPTINAGTAGDPLLGGFDVDGQERIIGSAPDIGADEFSPPDPPPGGSPPPGNTPPPSGEPDNDFALGKVKKNKKKGTAKLSVDVPGAGELELAANKKVKPTGKRADVAATVKLPIKPKRKAKKKLTETGKATVEAEVTYTPDSGEPNTQSKRVRLKKRI